MVSLAAPTAQQGAAPQGAAPPGAAAPPAKPIVPVAVSTVAANPDAYYGESVTLTAAVDQILSRSAFSISQRTVGDAINKTSGNDVLVLAPTLNGAVDRNAYVTVLGELVRFDPAEIARKAKGYALDLAPDVVAKYTGRPAVLATAVINGAMVDLAKRLPPPMTAEEEALSKVMKRVAPAFAALRTAAAASNAETTAQNATVLKQAFTETEAFWKTKGKTDAVQWAHDARTQAESIERDVAAANWDAVKASAGTLGQACQSCHGAYRERFDDGSYRIKMGSR
jgi:cytochrome c556